MKDIECITCKHILECKGKDNPTPCINYEKRETKNDSDNN